MSALMLSFLLFAVSGYINAELTPTELNVFKELANSVEALQTRLSSVENELERQKELNQNLEARLNAQSTLAFRTSDELGDVTYGKAKSGRVGKRRNNYTLVLN